MTVLGEISLADLVRAIAKLQAPRDAWDAIARSLGFELPTQATAPDAVEDVEQDRDGAKARPDLSGHEPTRRGTADPDARPSPTLRSTPRPLRSRLTPLAFRSSDAPLELRVVDALPASEFVAAPAPLPLLMPEAAIGILRAMLATSAPDGPLDVERAISTVARGEPLDEIPRRADPTLRRGADVLLDASVAMLPFAGDVEAVGRDLEDVIGRDRLELARFVGTPLRGAGTGLRSRWRPYEPPERPRPIVIVSDLAVGEVPVGEDHGSLWEWRQFADIVNRAGSPLIALTPYPASRVPTALRQAMLVVPWNRSLTAFRARRAVGGPIRVRV